jgi:aminoglycoside phosphotransferase (APT) family kinase protein
MTEEARDMQTTETDLNARIHEVLERACPEVHVTSLRPFEAGYSSKHWIAETDEGRLLVKVPQRNRDPEHLRGLMAATRVAAEHDIPVVRFRRLLQHDEAVGGPVLIQEYQDGDTVADLWDGLDEDQRTAICRELGDLVGRVHAITAPEFGPVLGGGHVATLRESVETELDGLLAQADPAMLGERDALRSAVLDLLHGLDESASVPALMHGDLWLPNVLVRDGRVSCILDFEHAVYADRFRDFGKLDEHVFDKFPQGRGAFLDAYGAAFPLPDDWEARVELSAVLHAVTMHVYFLRWSPQWAPQYARQAADWLAERT